MDEKCGQCLRITGKLGEDFLKKEFDPVIERDYGIRTKKNLREISLHNTPDSVTDIKAKKKLV
jgi:hypothetical protein